MMAPGLAKKFNQIKFPTGNVAPDLRHLTCEIERADADTQASGQRLLGA